MKRESTLVLRTFTQTIIQIVTQAVLHKYTVCVRADIPHPIIVIYVKTIY